MSKPKKPWPTKDAMTQIYDLHLWGGNDHDFYSGEGSHDPEIINPYIEVVTHFFKSFSKPITVCDLGCGDFNIGKHFYKHTKNYIAIDIVEPLITRNQVKFQAENLTFNCLDITKDELPKADCIVLRQVLQHLSNTEIERIVKKLKHYKYILLTEHIPKGDFTANIDIISGQGNRTKKQSGVDILKSPFGLNITSKTILNSHVLKNNKGQIVTTLFKI
ncbi:class I SAM-dependent methyltransferase [Tamlana sp. 62-3]|uniref:Class I SAM-dependent methyltransferase n=1 Tax=Neotamlana sargassicola TaxID=2883125 RepID=A0A9X1L5J5_9FLAO|nr:class I SAM-dependent methyltransferase [Tamlana sargassicola]MCB4806751.1 class I SAM-dependent methyltransferase [Tamlana sargassicola]